MTVIIQEDISMKIPAGTKINGIFGITVGNVNVYVSSEEKDSLSESDVSSNSGEQILIDAKQALQNNSKIGFKLHVQHKLTDNEVNELEEFVNQNVDIIWEAIQDNKSKFYVLVSFRKDEQNLNPSNNTRYQWFDKIKSCISEYTSIPAKHLNFVIIRSIVCYVMYMYSAGHIGE